MTRDLLLVGALAAFGFWTYHQLSGLPLVLFALVFAVVQGTAATGLWVVAHECGHEAFSPYQTVNDFFGFILHTAVLVPYWSWKYSHAKHHSKTNHLLDGETHVPGTRKGFERSLGSVVKLLGDDGFAIFQVLTHLLAGWPMYLLMNTTGGRRLFGKTLKEAGGIPDHFRPSSPLFPAKWSSLVLYSTLGCLAVIISLISWGRARGWGEVAVLYGGPYLVVNAWLVLYTWLHHTHENVPHYGDGDWSWLKGALGTIDRPYGWLIDTLHHNIGSTHVVHHIFHKLPHYHAVEATEAVKPVLGDLYNYDPMPIPQATFYTAKTCWYVEGIEGTQYYKGAKSTKAA